MHRNKKKRNIIIFSLVGVLLCMVAGYAAFQTRLEIKGTSKVTSNWNILITNVTAGTPTGSAENAVAPKWDKLTASMEANLYDKGDAMEYDVTIENQGTIDAKLNDILTNLENSNSEAVLITFSGYAKGEILKAKSTKIIHVKIEYNPEYEGGETSSEVEIDFDYGQDNKDPEAPKSYLVTYDCVTNGGNDCSNNNEYLISGSSVDLTKTGTKENYDFVGWNTDKDAEVGLTELTVEDKNIVLYAIYKSRDTTPPIIDNISTTSTSSTITVIVSAHDDESGITKYEYSKDNGKTWISNGNSNLYTFTGLTPNTTYDIKVRVTNGVNLADEKTAVTSIDITDKVTDNGDGLYEDEYEDDRYVYKGTDPNNYIEFNDELWRIVAKEANGTYKIVRNEVLSAQAWSTNSSNNWANASLNTYLKGEYYDELTSEAKGYIQTTKWPVGPVTMNNDDMAAQIESEKGSTVEGDIGLLTHSDYLRANTNKSQCGTDKLNFSNYRTCRETDWLYTSSSTWWTISPNAALSNSVWQVTTSGDINVYTVTNTRGVRPSVYLKSSITLSGEGTKSNPYKIGGSVSTLPVEKPTFTEEETSNGKDVTIHYPEGCGSSLTCTYQKNNGSVVNVTSTTANVAFTESGSLVARVSDGTNTVSSSYTVTIESNLVDVGGQPVEVVDSGDGLYEDSYEAGRLIYRGQNPDNYITFNGETWRIVAKETDGTYKIIRNDKLANRIYDEANHRSTANNSYCQQPQYGCGVYAAVSGTFSSPSGSQSGTVTEDSSIKIYLNDDYYVNNINETAKGQMTSHSFNIGAVEYLNDDASDSIKKNIAGEKMYTWTGNVGLANVSDILRASTNPLCTSATTSYNGTNDCNSNYLLDKGAASTLYYWTINAYSCESGGYSYSAWYGYVNSSRAHVNYNMARNSTYAPRPVVFLKSDITLNGSGTSEDPFIIAD